MPTAQASRQFRAFCHEHHLEMKLAEIVLHTDGNPTQTAAYVCPGNECAVHYTPSIGYFIANKEGQVGVDMTPHIACPGDGQPMYLAALDPKRRDFRLWRCPKCDFCRSNEEGLMK